MARQHPVAIAAIIALVLTVLLLACTKKSDRPVLSWFSETDDLGGAVADTGANGTMLMRGGQFAGGVGSIVDLTDDQKQKVKAILAQYRPRQRLDRDGQPVSSEEWTAMRDSLRVLRDSMRNRIASVLTSDQKALMDRIKSQLKTGVVPDTLVTIRVQRLASLLALTPDQQTMAFSILKMGMQQRLNARVQDSTAARNSDPSGGMLRRARAFGFPDTTILKILSDKQKQIMEQERQRIEQRFQSQRE